MMIIYYPNNNNKQFINTNKGNMKESYKPELIKLIPPFIAMVLFAIKGYFNRYLDLTSGLLLAFSIFYIIFMAARYLGNEQSK